MKVLTRNQRSGSNPIDYSVTVTGNSGVDVFVITTAALFGFSDTTGLLSVSVANNNSVGNYAFDDVITGGSLAPVPLPAALPLFASGLGILGLFGWRRKRVAAA